MQSLDTTAAVSPGKVTWLDTNSPSSGLRSRVEGCVVRAGLESTGIVGQARAFLNTHDPTTWLIERERFEEGFARSSSGTTEYLVELGVTTVGVDYLSVESLEDEKVRAHNALLGAVVEAWINSFACLPPKLAGSDGAPARAVLVSDLRGGSAA